MEGPQLSLKASTERSMVVSVAAINSWQNLEPMESATATYLCHGDAKTAKTVLGTVLKVQIGIGLWLTVFMSQGYCNFPASLDSGSPPRSSTKLFKLSASVSGVHLLSLHAGWNVSVPVGYWMEGLVSLPLGLLLETACNMAACSVSEGGMGRHQSISQVSS